MKTSSLIAAGTALAGFAMGWILKPGGDGSAHQLANSEPPPRERPKNAELVAPGRTSPRDPISLASSPSGIVDPVSVRREQAYHQLTGKKEKARLARFAEALGLDIDQLEAIASLLSKHKGATNASPDGLLTEAADGKLDFEDALLALLNDEQKDRLAAFKTRTTENQIETSAMQDLAKVMSVVDLSSTQRENLLNNFREKNRVAYASEPDTWDLLTDNGTGLANGNASFNRYRDIFSDPSVTSDPIKLADRIAAEEKLRIEENLGILSGELTEQQMAEFRASIEGKSVTLFGKSIRDPRFR
ncbi:hypothetical protein ACFQY0_19345 [Haloferula chungangensis]|uniref:Uncharacterized protein n=1 Tax=Haloferula chungangensis TaxID=1048331 RepID=A0ABW2LCY6_9BACT